MDVLLGVLAGLAASTLLAGCSVLIDVGEPQCATDQQCIETGLGIACVQGVCEGSASPAPMDDDASVPAPPEEQCGDGPACSAQSTCMSDRCIPNALMERVACARDPVPTIDESTTLAYDVELTEFIMSTMPLEASVLACRAQDVTCESPIDELEYSGPGTGNITVSLYPGFTGFLDVQAETILPTLFYLTRPLTPETAPESVTLVTEIQLIGLAGLVRYEVTPGTGLVVLEMRDCDDRPFGGIHFEANSENALPFYFVDAQPNVDTEETVADEVNDVALGGFINVPPGFVSFTALVADTGAVIGTFNARVRDTGLTYITLYPRF